MWELFFYYGALLAYILSLLMYWSFVALRRPILIGHGELSFTIGYILNTLALGARWYALGRLPLESHFDFILWLIWGIGLGLQILAGRFRYKALGVFIMPVIIMLYLYSTTNFAITAFTPAVGNIWLTLHLITAIAGYGTLTMAFALACPRLLDGHGNMEMSSAVRETTDTLLFRILIRGFGLLTLVVVTGAIWSWTAHATLWTWPAQIWPLITWIIYAASAYTVFTDKTKGRPIAWLTVFGFLSMIISVLAGNIWV